MGFGISKQSDKIQCRHCKGYLLRGEIYYLMAFKAGGRRIAMFFHAHEFDCYLEWVKTKYENKKQEFEYKHLPKIGRPRIYKDGKEVHRVKSLIRYHRGKGNEERVGELQAELDKLLIGG